MIGIGAFRQPRLAGARVAAGMLRATMAGARCTSGEALSVLGFLGMASEIAVVTAPVTTSNPTRVPH
jgi:hypothetical protein